ncbi:pectate lyase-like adhesive domain-containing protein [Staphylococcus debuckii]|uniref:pectate lyase-like adhesive domain-containing protein n=1 Tax=Staphylococcus debuckii TaxID=2044912 RepID=UPI000F438DA4|nr:pectate lyase-like adhesive domain-containing protein [Staphylococcus debuckii]AYU54290.1 YSIRK-type signal peptide-containing protein [Staphylococcus debuckii]
MSKRRKTEKMFLQQKLNKFSIRKFSVGVASILIGGVLYLNANEAEAAENTVDVNPAVAQVPESGKAEVAKPEAQATEPAKAEVAKPEAQATEPAKAEVAKPEAQVSEPAKAEVAKPEAQATEPAKAEVAKPEVQATEPAKAEVAKSEAQATESAKAEVAKSEAQATEPAKAEVAKSEAQATEPAKAETQDFVTPPKKIAKRSLSANNLQTQPAKQVGTWEQIVSALNDTSVSNIQLTKNITANQNAMLNANTGRKVVIDGAGHTLDSSNYYVDVPVTSRNWDLTIQNSDIKTNNINGLINFAPSPNSNNIVTFKDVNHTGNNLIDDTDINNNLTVNLEGKVNSISNDNAVNRSNIGAKNINIDQEATVTVERKGLGNALRVSDGGTITSGTDSQINVNTTTANPWGVLNGNTAFKLGNNSSLLFGDNSKVDVTGQNIFDFGNNATFDTGTNSQVTVNQKGNGNIVNMGKGSTFEVASKSQFIANSDGHRVGDWQSNNLIGLDGNSQILIDDHAKLLLDAKNHQWNPDTKTQVGAYNDLVNINAVGNETALLHVADNATLDLRTDNRDYYAEVISIPLGGTNAERKYVFDNAYYVNLQKTSTVTSGESPNGVKPNLIFMDPASPGYFQWNGSYIAKTWAPKVFSNPDQSEDATNVWDNVVDLRAEQEGFNTGVPTYNQKESTAVSKSGTPLSDLNLNYAQRLVLISNSSENPEAKTVEGTPEIKNEKIPFETKIKLDPKMKPGSEDKVVQEGKDGNRKTTTPIFVNSITGEKVSEGTPVVETTPPVDKIINYAPEEIAPGTRTEFDPNLPAGQEKVTPGVPGLKDPKTGEIIKDPIDEVVKKAETRFRTKQWMNSIRMSQQVKHKKYQANRA